MKLLFFFYYLCVLQVYSCYSCFFVLMILRPPRSTRTDTLCPYTTLFRSNPVGGCRPLLVQMPVFLALYWTLLEAVELRHAPWIGWIQNLTAPDPYFILRSEEHTSELQSLMRISYAVFCLKKKN